MGWTSSDSWKKPADAFKDALTEVRGGELRLAVKAVRETKGDDFGEGEMVGLDGENRLVAIKIEKGARYPMNGKPIVSWGHKVMDEGMGPYLNLVAPSKARLKQWAREAVPCPEGYAENFRQRLGLPFNNKTPPKGG